MRSLVFAVVVVLGTTTGHLELGRPVVCHRICNSALQYAVAHAAPSTGTKLAAR